MAEEEEEKMNVLHMLQFSIGVGLILIVAAWGLYVWLRRTGQLKTKVTESHSQRRSR